jgi:hypothetical protein
MKKIVLFTLLLFVYAPANAQFTTNSGLTTTLDKVGIGTTSLDPGCQLTVVGGINIGGEGNGSLKVRHVNGKHYKSAALDHLYFNYNTGKDVYVGYGGQNSNMFVSGAMTVVGGMNIGGEGNGSLKVRHVNGKHYKSAALDHLYLNYNTGKDVYVGYGGQNSSMFISGKIGIGTTALGSHELAVEGSIGAREIKVEASGWPDFVFEKDYKLRTLEDVESYIDENRHLPEIRSETEVLENGINLGELNAKLLQKIEELTLYLIEQNKKIKEQIEKIAEIEKQSIEYQSRLLLLEKQLKKQ